MLEHYMVRILVFSENCIDQPDPRPRALTPDRASLLARVVAYFVGNMARFDEEQVVKRYEGHSWCDSTERELNYEIMTGRRTGDPI
jgi:hypothetical protein